MTGPIAPDALREAVARALHDLGPCDDSDCTDPHDWGYCDKRAEVALAVVAKHRDAEVERLAAGWDASDAVNMQGVALVKALAAQRDAALDRIARATTWIDEWAPSQTSLRAILTDEPTRRDILAQMTRDGVAAGGYDERP